MRPTVALVAVNYKTYDLIDRLIDSFILHRLPHQSLLVVDNEYSREWEFDKLPSFIQVRTVSGNIGYANACNLGYRRTTSAYIGFLNSDVQLVDSESIDRIVDFLEENPDIGAAGPLQYDAGRVTHAGIYGSYVNATHRGWKSMVLPEYREDAVDVTSVSGSALFMRRNIANELADCRVMGKLYGEHGNVFPPYPHFWEDTALCAHAKAHGYKLGYVGSASMIHSWHKSSPVGSQSKNHAIGKSKFIEFCKEHEIQYD